jgi:predicted nucleotidyltransferase
MSIFLLIKENKNAFVSLCHKHRVNKMYAFGSSVTGRFNPDKSDIDLVVDLAIKDPVDYGETLFSLWDNLELLFNRKVDLLTEESIHNPYLRKTINATKQLIYDRQGEKISV